MLNSLSEDFYYTKNHEWLHVDENLVTVGLTGYAIAQLGEVLYLDLPEDGQSVHPNQNLGSIESVLQLHDLVLSLTGTILEINTALVEDPTPINDDPTGEGWLFRIELDNERDLANFFRAKEYKEYISTALKSAAAEE